MIWVIEISLALIIVIIMFVVGAIELLLANILYVLIALVLLGVVFYAMAEWEITVPIIIFLSIAVLISVPVGTKISERAELNRSIVEISVATDDCLVYDDAGDEYIIPAGAVIARYCNPNEYSRNSIVYFSKLHVCCWYYNGTIYESTERNYGDTPQSAEYFGVKYHEWNTIVMEEMTYKKFSRSDWWLPYI